jgi:thioredoxin 1
MAEIGYIPGNELNDLISNSDNLIIVDFTATWCGPCRKILPYMEQLAETYPDNVQVFKLDIDQEKATATQFEVKRIPAVLFFQGGEVVERVVGVAPYDRFAEITETHIQS